MHKRIVSLGIWLAFFAFDIQLLNAEWNPPSELSLKEIIEMSNTVLAMPDIKLKIEEDIFHIRALGMGWDLGGQVYQPEDPC